MLSATNVTIGGDIMLRYHVDQVKRVSLACYKETGSLENKNIKSLRPLYHYTGEHLGLN